MAWGANKSIPTGQFFHSDPTRRLALAAEVENGANGNIGVGNSRSCPAIRFRIMALNYPPQNFSNALDPEKSKRNRRV